MNQEKIREIKEKMEKEREKLYLLVREYGLDSPQVLEQSRLIDGLLLALFALEKQTDTQENF
ncbi:MAG: Spo0E family sporulation regulatory protein-aspartic acid phosphatase [Dethiobacter sp.]|jgi:hypothetical protein|nr:Spo0E family sporulation regulatory protein-aspartic acid phosphatase [Dethiobacter sp.]MBS3901437.1 Spo0E family sporulation regulatory protein-aspartic acid phosphatase [Dethiobacter sp.]MBS3988629.1 Spo0E family sporulation regulatory protein-aspartic acid phosphatase [Dethiobacter sp.]